MDATNSNFILLLLLILPLVFLGFIIWFVLKQEAKKHQLQHEERKLSLERGLPLPDGEVSRNRALGAMGILVPLGSLGAASGVTALLLQQNSLENSERALIAVWTACGLVAACGVMAVVARLRAR
ncbi:MAG TPA: hypothetical protein PKA06_12335 [Gemmatales bacterium]|nr:hypothetical protein [Gemmatales bacterium]